MAIQIVATFSLCILIWLGIPNLNLECIRLALLQYHQDTGMRPMLYVMVDNASDNKSRFMLGGLGSLVLHDYITGVEVAMLPVGHTHEDIDQTFRVIANALIRAGFVGTIDQYMEIIASAWEGERQYVKCLSAVHDYRSWLIGNVWETSATKDDDVNMLRQD